MLRRHLLLVTAAVAVASPLAAFAAWTGAPANPPSSNANGPVWLQTGAATPQTGKISVSAGLINSVTTTQDMYFTSGKALRADLAGVSVMNMGNWGSGASGFTLGLYGNLNVAGFGGVNGTVSASQLCLGGDCRLVWPSSGGSGDVTDVTPGVGLTATSTGGPAVQIGLATNYMNGSAYDSRFVNVTGDSMTGNLLVGTSTAAIPSASGIPFVVSGVNRGIDVQLYSPTNFNSVALSVTNPTPATGRAAVFYSGTSKKVTIGDQFNGIEVISDGAMGVGSVGVSSTNSVYTGVYGKGGQFGVVGETGGNQYSAGVKGYANPGSFAPGVYGLATRYGVIGESTGAWAGVYGSSTGSGATGVYGVGKGASSEGGYFVGDYTGVYAYGTTYGLTAYSPGNGAIYASGTANGAFGRAEGVNGIGIRGEARNTGGTGVYGEGAAYAVQGISSAASGGTGVYGQGSTNGYGVYGFVGGATGIGVRGRNGTTDSEAHLADANYGVWAIGAPGTSGVGVYGSSGGNGVYGRSTGPSGYYAVYGDATGGYGGVYGEGQVYGGFFRSINGGSAVFGYSDNFSSGTGVNGDGTKYGVVGNAPSTWCGNLTCGNYGVSGYGNVGVRGTGQGTGNSWGVMGSGPVGGEFFTTTADGVALYTDGWIDVWKDGSGGTTTGVKIRNGLNNSAWIATMFDGNWPTFRYGGSGSGSAAGFTFQRSDLTDLMYVTNAGNFTIAGSVGKKSGGSASWDTTSDIRLKDVLGDYKRGLSEITQLNPIYFKYKVGNVRKIEDTDTTYVGFSAQAVEKLIPEAIKTQKDGYKDITVDPIWWAMVNSIKELKTQNDDLKTKLEGLEARLEKLEAK